MTAPAIYDLESVLEKQPGRSAQLRAAAQKAKDEGDFARARTLTLAAEAAERGEEEAARSLRENLPRPVAAADATAIQRPDLPSPVPQPKPYTPPVAPPAPPPPAQPDASAMVRDEFTLRQKGTAQRNPVLLQQAEQIKAQRQGVVTVGPVQSAVGPHGESLIPGDEMARIATGDRGLAPAINADLRLARDPVGADQIRPEIRKRMAPGVGATAANIALSNAMSVFSPEAASSATEEALRRFTEGGGDASKNATLFGLAGAGGEVAGTGPLLKGPSVAARYGARTVAPAVAEGASAALRELAGQGEVRVASRAQRAAQAAREVAPAVRRVATESFKQGAEVGATMAAEGAVGDVATGQSPKEIGKRALERGAVGTLLGAALHALPATAGEVGARRAGRSAVQELPEDIRSAVAGERMRRADRGTEEVAAAPEEGYTGRTDIVRRPNIYDVGAASAQRVAERPPTVREAPEEYRGSHGAPGPEDGAPLHEMTGTYPDDIYGPNAARYYGSGGDQVGLDHESTRVIQSLRGKPDAPVKIYRAIPDDITTAEKIAKLEKQKAFILRRGKLPPGVETNLSSSAYYDRISNEIQQLQSAPAKDEVPGQIHPGDWVTINRAYARQHGQSTLNGNFRILSKTVKAKELFTEGNSLHEFGYHPSDQTSVGEAAGPGYAPQPRFYSRLEKAIEAAPFEKGTAQQWRAALTKNVAKGEREYTGVEKFLADNEGKVLSRGDVQGAYVRGKINLTETTLDQGDDFRALSHEEGALAQELNDHLYNLRRSLEPRGWSQTKIANIVNRLHSPESVESVIAEYGFDAQQARLARDIKRTSAEHGNVAQRMDELRNTSTKYENYTEPGGENYREILIQHDRPSNAELNQFASWAKKRHGLTASRVASILNDPVTRKSFIEEFQQETGTKLDPTQPVMDEFRSSHFDQPNILAHARVKDRTLPNGEKALFVEEIQSDWHQRGRDRGYMTPEKRAEIQARESELIRNVEETRLRLRNQVHDEIGDLNLTHISDPEGGEPFGGIMSAGGRSHPTGRMFDVTVAGEPFTIYRYDQAVAGSDGTRRVYRADGGTRNQFQNIVAKTSVEMAQKLRDAIIHDRTSTHPEMEAAQAAMREGEDAQRNAIHAPPEGPFKKTEEWMGLAMKRLIDEAVKGGYDRVIWTSGEQQKNRYNLGQAVSEIAYDPESGSFSAYGHGGQTVHTGKYDPRALVDVVGKEVAQKLLQTPLKPHPDWMIPGVHSLKGEDLEVGGEGMRSFYDRMIPNWVSDYAKKMGVKLEVEPSEVFGRSKQEIDADIEKLAQEYADPNEDFQPDYTQTARYRQLMKERTNAPDRPDNSGYTGTVPERAELEQRLRRRGVLNEDGEEVSPDAPDDPVDMEILNILTRMDKYDEDMREAIEHTLEALEADTDHETAQIVAHELGGEWIPRRKQGVGQNLGFRVTPELREKVQREGQPVLAPTQQYTPTTATGKKIQSELADLGEEDAPVAAAALEEHGAAVDAPPKVETAAKGLLRRVPGLKAWSASRSTLTELMKKRHSDPIVGKRFENEADIALHAQIFRDPRFETLRVIYVRGNEIVAVEGVSQRLPGSAAFSHYGSDDMAEAMVRSRFSAHNADGFYFLHNHPTGDPTPSGLDPRAPGDVQFQATMRKKFPATLKGHIIINSGAWTFLDVPEIGEDGAYYPTVSSQFFRKGQQAAVLMNDPLLQPDPGLEHPHLGKAPRTSTDLANMAKEMQIGNDSVLLYHMGSSGKIIALQEVPFKDIEKPSAEFREKVFNWSRQLGSREILAVSANPQHRPALKHLTETGDVRDAVYILNAGTPGAVGVPTASFIPVQSQLAKMQATASELNREPFGRVKEDLPRYRREGQGEEYEADVDAGKDPRLVNLAKFDLDPGGEKRLRDLIEQKGYTKKRVTHEETREVARELGLDPDRLIRNAERRLSGAELLALRDAISENVDAMESAAKVLADPQSTSPQREQAQQLMTRLHNQTEQFTARFIREREQTGRDLNALKIIAQRSLDPATWLAQAERIKGLALTPEEAIEISQLAKGKDRNGLIHYVSSLHRSTKLDKFLTLWKAGLLTAPPTHAANLLGNVSMAALETAKEPIAYVLDAVISLIRGEAMSKSPSFRGLFTSQLTGAARGTKAAYKIMKTGVNPEGSSKWNLTGRTNFNNAILQGYTDLVFNSLSAEDQIFKGASFARHLEEHSRLRAKDIARKSGGTITFKEALADIRKEPPNDVILKAIAGAEFDTFQNDNPVSSGVAAFNRAVSRSSVLRTGSTVTMPFIKTPTNVTARLFDYTPAGFFRLLDSEVRGDQKKLSEALARAGLGSSLLWYGATLAAAGLATGAMPENQAEREAWNAEGKLPNAIKIKGKWSQVGRITPAGMLVALGAQLYTAWHKAENATEAVSGGLAATGRLITDQPFLQGISRTLGALSDPANEGKRFIENTAGSVVPAIVSRVARAVDPKEREARGVTDIIKSKIPVVRETLPAKRDVFGREVPNRQSFLSTMLDPTGTRKDTTTPLLAEMERLGVTPILPSSAVRDSTAGKKQQRKRTPEERRAWLTDVGPELEKSLTLLVADPSYKALPDEQKEDLFRAVQDRVRREGRDRELAAGTERSPAADIVRESIESVAETIQNKAMREKISTLAKSAAKGDFAPLAALPDSTKEKLGSRLVTAQRDTVRKELDRLLAAKTLDADKLREAAARYEALGGDVDDVVKRRIEREAAVRATVNAASVLRK